MPKPYGQWPHKTHRIKKPRSIESKIGELIFWCLVLFSVFGIYWLSLMYGIVK